jgi:hypothetical protein
MDSCVLTPIKIADQTKKHPKTKARLSQSHPPSLYHAVAEQAEKRGKSALAGFTGYQNDCFLKGQD